MGENMNISKQKLLSAILNASGKKINKNAVERAAGGDISALASGLDEENRRMLNEALSDKNKAKEILSSKEAREILKKLSGGGGNGRS